MNHLDGPTGNKDEEQDLWLVEFYSRINEKKGEERKFKQVQSHMSTSGPAIGGSSIAVGAEKERRDVLVASSTSRRARVEKPDFIGLDMSNQGLFSLSSRIGFYSQLQTLILVNNNLTTLPETLFSHLTGLTHLDLGNNQLSRIPPQIDQLSNLKFFNLYNNHISELPMEMGRLHRLQSLGLDGNPLQMPPPVVIQEGTKSIVSYLRDRMQPPVAPLDRGWNVLVEDDGKIPKSNKIRFWCYNALAESYATPDRHSYCPSWSLEWEYRKKKIMEQMHQYEADILCMQEVEAKQYQESFRPEMAQLGYSGVFRPKSRARTRDDYGNVDGCVIFYKNDKFRLVEEVLIEYQALAIKRFSDLEGDRIGFERLMVRDNIAVALVLQLQTQSKRKGKRHVNNKTRNIIVANTHIHWDPSMSDVKLMQVIFLTEELSALREKYGDPNIPLIVAGDFNSVPQSAVYQLMSTGSVPNDHRDWNGFNYGRYTKSAISHNLSLASAYSYIGEPPFTNYNGDFIGVLDYIWYSEETMRVLGVLSPITMEEVNMQRTPLPNPHFPSDHLCIMAEFEIIDEANNHNNNIGSPNNSYISGNTMNSNKSVIGSRSNVRG